MTSALVCIALVNAGIWSFVALAVGLEPPPGQRRTPDGSLPPASADVLGPKVSGSTGPRPPVRASARCERGPTRTRAPSGARRTSHHRREVDTP